MRSFTLALISLLFITSFSHALKAQTADEKKRVTELMEFMQFTFNTLGNKDVPTKDKNVITDKTYAKIFTGANAQIEDDLSERQVSLNKSVQNYLKDIDILYKSLKFDFKISQVEKLSSSQKSYFKVSFTSSLKGITVDGKAYETSSKRFAEINYDEQQQVYKVASIYSSGIRDLKAFQQWWDALDFEWKVVFQRAIGANVNLNEPYKVLGIKKVDISYNRYITNLNPLLNLQELEVLNMSNTAIHDISVASELPGLKELYMSNTDIKTLDPLIELNHLEVVFFDNTFISSLAPLDNIKSLKKVVCSNTPIDLKEIKQFEAYHPKCQVVYETTDLVGWWKNLPLAWKEAFKEQFKITSTVPSGEELARIKATEEINIEGKSQIVSLQPIADFKNVQNLNLKKSSVNSLAPIANYTELERLDISDTPVDSLGPVSQMELKLLAADYSKVGQAELNRYQEAHPSATVIFKTMDYTVWWIRLSKEWKQIFTDHVGYRGEIDKLPLSKLYDILELQKLVVPEGSGIENVAPLSSLKELRDLKISKVMKISDLSPISKLTKLEKLDCSYNPVSDLSPLVGMKNLKELNIDYTRVGDLSTIESVRSIQVLSFSGTKISNINSLRKLDQLVEVDLQNTSVSNLSPLYTLIHLAKVSCFNTKVSQKDIEKFKEVKPSCQVVYY